MDLHEVICQHIEDYKTEGVERRDFGIKDGKGRSLGANAVKCSGIRVSTKRMLHISCQQDPLKPEGPVYGFRPQAQRNGEAFGAVQSTRWFETPADRDAAIAKYFVMAEKTATKNAA